VIDIPREKVKALRALYRERDRLIQAKTEEINRFCADLVDELDPEKLIYPVYVDVEKGVLREPDKPQGIQLQQRP